MIKRNKIKIRINGKKLVLSSTDTLDDLVNKLNIPIKKVAIELNRKIIDKKKIKKIKLKKNDTIEIVHFIGGG
mgnify:CR=1 FL=1|tara:strand:+ start:478 stop:696 length:219 start_codon:yes stop_codon:yes gene_type:complete